jgi:methionyl aminopeptidase
MKDEMTAYSTSAIQRETVRYKGENIILHVPEDFEGMRAAGQLTAQVLDYITPFLKPGISTGEIDRLCHQYIVDHGAIPAPLNYKGYPKSICTSINHVVCHGIPNDDKILRDGDIINVDITVILNGWFGDSSRTFAVGKIGVKAQALVNTTFEAMMHGIEMVKPGVTLGDIGHTIQTYAEKKGYSVVREFCGHGIGLIFHMAPNVLHYGRPGEGLVLQEGMFFTIEPMINAGRSEVKILGDGWTAVTRDKSLSAQFEHTIGVTANGYEIFTLSS